MSPRHALVNVCARRGSPTTSSGATSCPRTPRFSSGPIGTRRHHQVRRGTKGRRSVRSRVGRSARPGPSVQVRSLEHPLSRGQSANILVRSRTSLMLQNEETPGQLGFRSVARGGVEPPTFRFSSRSCPVDCGADLRGCDLDGCLAWFFDTISDRMVVTGRGGLVMAGSDIGCPGVGYGCQVHASVVWSQVRLWALPASGGSASCWTPWSSSANSRGRRSVRSRRWTQAR